MMTWAVRVRRDKRRRCRSTHGHNQMAESSGMSIGRTSTGYLIRVDGRGTAQQSPAFQRVIDDIMQAGDSSVAVDLTTCTYLDSTFLGCLVRLQRHSGDARSDQLVIVAPPETRSRLFQTKQIEKVLHFVDSGAEPVGETVDVPMQVTAPQDFGRHVAEAHRALAGLGGSEAKAFERVAQQIEDELDASS
jgi:anti-anti-sigma regulatory factor